LKGKEEGEEEEKQEEYWWFSFSISGMCYGQNRLC
jgi:hypothetical protein